VQALRTLGQWALGPLGLDRIELLIEPENMGSIIVAERAGYEREGLLRGKALLHGERRDMLMYARVRS
jgi:RimJ/RimL family protein N-acetyltransferase